MEKGKWKDTSDGTLRIFLHKNPTRQELAERYQIFQRD